MNPGAISLHDLATVLKSPELGLTRALCLDGGFEAQLFVRRHDFISLGEYLGFPNETVYIPGLYHTLPSVITVERR